MNALYELFGISHAVAQSVMNPQPGILDENGRVPIGALFLLMDGALGIEAATDLGAGWQLITTHLRLDVLREPFVAQRLHTATCVDLVDANSVFSHGEIFDDAGHLLATASGRFAVFSSSQRAASRIEVGARRPRQALPEREVFGTQAPLDRLDLQSPIHMTLRSRATASPGALELDVTASRTLSNDRGGVHGGIVGLIGERALDLLVALYSDHRSFPLTFQVTFVRPVAAADQRIRSVASLDHSGRSFAAGTTRVLDHRERLIAIVTGAYRLHPHVLTASPSQEKSEMIK